MSTKNPKEQQDESIRTPEEICKFLDVLIANDNAYLSSLETKFMNDMIEAKNAITQNQTTLINLQKLMLGGDAEKIKIFVETVNKNINKGMNEQKNKIPQKEVSNES